MTSNNETVSRETPWAGNIAKTMTSNGKQFPVTREMLTAVARDGWNLSAVFKFFFCFFSSSRETLRFPGNKIHCSPWDQSLSVNCYTTVVTLLPEIFFYSSLTNFATRTASLIFLLSRSPESKEKKALCHQPLIIVSDWRIFLIALRVIWLDGLNTFNDVIGQKKMTS